MVSLKTRLILTYTLLICIGMVLLSAAINLFADSLFSAFVKKNIQEQSNIIVEALQEQYSETNRSFNKMTLMAIGMSYVRQGYIISLSDTKGNVIWDARECDMRRCSEKTAEIEHRMQQEHRTNGGFAKQVFPMQVNGEQIATATIETYGPFFYNEHESWFMRTLNQLMLGIGVLFSAISALISIIIARTLAKPILKTATTAQQIAQGDLSIRINNHFKTREISELANSVNHLASTLERGDRWQKRLTSDIAHELRTPLTTLQGNLEAMIDGVWAPTPERLSSSYDEIVRLTKLVEDLNLVSILEQENLQLQKREADICALANAVTEQFLPKAKEKGISLTCNVSPPLIACVDIDRLKQVLVNLLSNAINYTDTGEVSLTLSIENQHLKIVVADSGIGIPEEELPYIFDRFYRSDKSRNRKTGGAGIGLTVVSAIVDAHNGRVFVESAVSLGSTVTVLLPLS